MSKVYSFRLNENNPREAQAKEVIETWVSKGYSLRHIITEALISFQANESDRHDALEVILKKITNMVKSFDAGTIEAGGENETLPKGFVSSLSKSVKPGLKVNQT